MISKTLLVQQLELFEDVSAQGTDLDNSILVGARRFYWELKKSPRTRFFHNDLLLLVFALLSTLVTYSSKDFLSNTSETPEQ